MGDVALLLLGWYDQHARTLPWRAPPGAPPPDVYRVWLSEIMLQQTVTAAAAPYFAAFTARWPTVAALAGADDGDVMAAWAGLGYYARARNLLAAARAVVAAGGVFPADEAGLRALPGVGAYTAAAIAAIAHGQRAVVVDANVERVVARLFAIDQPLPAARAAIRAAADAVTPDARAGDFAQAMMDLGATICTARAPKCLACPLTSRCAGRAAGLADSLPVKPRRAAKPVRRGTAWWIIADGAVWLEQRPPRGMLGGMAAPPDDGWGIAGDGDGIAPFAADWRDMGAVTHDFTHFRLMLSVMFAMVQACDMTGRHGQWVPTTDLGKAGLPTLFAKAATRALAAMGEQ